jgi:DUF1680 family protein
VADYLISTYFRSADGLFVNLFVPSEVSWQVSGQRARLIQTTNFPDKESTELRLDLPAPAEFTVNVRIPGWLQSPASISVNGKDASVPVERGSFAAIRRTWRNNDTIEVSLPFSLRHEAIDAENPNRVALMRGPLMMVALEPELKIDGKQSKAHDGSIGGSRAGQDLQLKAVHEDLTFVPFYSVGEQNYTTYVELA